MGRPLRVAPGGYVYHVLNRGNGRMRLFHKEADYQAFQRIMTEALEHVPGMRLVAWCLMPKGGKEKVSGPFFLTRRR
jgi:putative transposase